MHTTIEELRSELRADWDSGDPWGSTMAWAFALAGELHYRGEGAADLAAARYSPGAGGDGREPDSYHAEIAAEASTPALLHWFRRLMRWRGVLEAAGRDY